MVGVVCDAEAGLDDLGDPLGGPPFGGQTMFPRPGLEGAFENRPILRLQAWRASGLGRLLEGGLAALFPGFVPTAGRRAGNAQSACHFSGRHSFVK